MCMRQSLQPQETRHTLIVFYGAVSQSVRIASPSRALRALVIDFLRLDLGL
jgi:hypothetical protein